MCYFNSNKKGESINRGYTINSSIMALDVKFKYLLLNSDENQFENSTNNILVCIGARSRRM